MTQPEAKKCPGVPAAAGSWTSRGRTFPRDFRARVVLLTLAFEPLAARPRECVSDVFSRLDGGLGYGSGRESIHTRPRPPHLHPHLSAPTKISPLRPQQAVSPEHPSWVQSLLYPDTFCLPHPKLSLPVSKGVSHLVWFFVVVVSLSLSQLSLDPTARKQGSLLS